MTQEPTSGLDSTASFEVIKYLKFVAQKQNVSTYDKDEDSLHISAWKKKLS